jgi:hypothetical protein
MVMFMVNFLHGFGMCPEYDRLLRIETQIARSVVKRMDLNKGLYIPPDIVIGRHVFFAVDNIDFAERCMPQPWQSTRKLMWGKKKLRWNLQTWAKIAHLETCLKPSLWTAHHLLPCLPLMYTDNKSQANIS